MRRIIDLNRWIGKGQRSAVPSLMPRYAPVGDDAHIVPPAQHPNKAPVGVGVPDVPPAPHLMFRTRRAGCPHPPSMHRTFL